MILPKQGVYEVKYGFIRMQLPALLELISKKYIVTVHRKRRLSGAVDNTP